jgi:hypothetical protein
VAKAAEVERRGVVLNLMSSHAGRAFIFDRLVRCHIFSSSFTPEALAMAFAEGERNVGLQDLNDVMRFAPDQYVQMMREANDKEIADGRRTDSGLSGSDEDLGWADSGRDDPASGSASPDLFEGLEPSQPN